MCLNFCLFVASNWTGFAKLTALVHHEYAEFTLGIKAFFSLDPHSLEQFGLSLSTEASFGNGDVVGHGEPDWFIIERNILLDSEMSDICRVVYHVPFPFEFEVSDVRDLKGAYKIIVLIITFLACLGVFVDDG